jgi:ElaB/YqjD/DUF883 family membrane-anchored ribosome-binding protein
MRNKEVKMANEATKTVKTEDGFLGEAKNVIEQAVKTGIAFETLKTQATNAIDSGIEDAKRMVKRGQYAAEDMVEDTQHMIKHDPLRSVGITFGIGFGLGAIVGLLIASRKNAR